MPTKIDSTKEAVSIDVSLEDILNKRKKNTEQFEQHLFNKVAYVMNTKLLEKAQDQRYLDILIGSSDMFKNFKAFEKAMQPTIQAIREKGFKVALKTSALEFKSWTVFMSTHYFIRISGW